MPATQSNVSWVYKMEDQKIYHTIITAIRTDQGVKPAETCECDSAVRRVPCLGETLNTRGGTEEVLEGGMIELDAVLSGMFKWGDEENGMHSVERAVESGFIEAEDIGV